MTIKLILKLSYWQNEWLVNSFQARVEWLIDLLTDCSDWLAGWLADYLNEWMNECYVVMEMYFHFYAEDVVEVVWGGLKHIVTTYIRLIQLRK